MPDAFAGAVGQRRAFDLIGAGGGTPEEIGWEKAYRTVGNVMRVSERLATVAASLRDADGISATLIVKAERYR